MKPKAGRNDLCPCGSGKKYKNCCLQENVTENGSSLKKKFTARVISAGGAVGEAAAAANQTAAQATTVQNKALQDYDSLMERSFGHAFRRYETGPPKPDSPSQYISEEQEL